MAKVVRVSGYRGLFYMCKGLRGYNGWCLNELRVIGNMGKGLNGFRYKHY